MNCAKIAPLPLPTLVPLPGGPQARSKGILVLYYAVTGSPRAVACRGSGVGIICEDEGEDLHRSAAPGTGQRGLSI